MVVDVWMDSDPGMWPYRARVTLTLYESRPIYDQTKNDMFVFSSKKNAGLNFFTVKIVSAVVAYCNYKKQAIYS